MHAGCGRPVKIHFVNTGNAAGGPAPQHPSSWSVTSYTVEVTGSRGNCSSLHGDARSIGPSICAPVMSVCQVVHALTYRGWSRHTVKCRPAPVCRSRASRGRGAFSSTVDRSAHGCPSRARLRGTVRNMEDEHRRVPAGYAASVTSVILPSTMQPDQCLS